VPVVGIDEPRRIADTERAAVDGDVAQRRAWRGERDGERRLGETVDREHRIASETVRRERVEEFPGEIDRDRLRAVEDEPDAAQIVPVELPVAQRAQEMPIPEVWRAGDRRSLLVREFHPQERTPHEQVGRHQVLAHARVHHHQMKADQPHVVRERHPAERRIVGREPGSLSRALGVREDVAVGQHDTLGCARRAGRELDECRVVGAHLRGLPGATHVLELIDQECPRVERGPRGRFVGCGCVGRKAVAQLAVRVEPRCAELSRDPEQLVLVLVADADGDRHWHDAAVQARPVRVDELLVAGHVQDQPVARPRAE
jgi:hypothetical protein